MRGVVHMILKDIHFYCFCSPYYFSQIFASVLFVISVDKHSILVLPVQWLVLYVWWKNWHIWLLATERHVIWYQCYFPLSILPHSPWGIEGKEFWKMLASLYCPIAKLLGRKDLIYQLSPYNLHLFISYMCASSSNNCTALANGSKCHI